MSKILIIFGSTGGNTEIVCNKVSEILSKAHSVSVQRVEMSCIEDPKKYDLCVLASPTYGQGVLEMSFIPFREKMKSVDYTNTNFCVIGLGDYKYHDDYHLESINILETTIKESNGTIISPPLRVSKSPLKFLNSTITKWSKTLSESLS